MSITNRNFHITSDDPFIGFVDLLNGDQFDVRLDLVLRAEVEHVLCFFDAADERQENLSPL